MGYGLGGGPEPPRVRLVWVRVSGNGSSPLRRVRTQMGPWWGSLARVVPKIFKRYPAAGSGYM